MKNYLYKPQLNFNYTFNSKEYNGVSSHYCWTKRKKNAKKIIENYKLCDEITIYVNPKVPSEAYVDMDNINYQVNIVQWIDITLIIGLLSGVYLYGYFC